jgi:S1-C subfamily serine protease
VDPARVPCPNCREAISGDATVCPQCRTSALVDLIVGEALANPKTRYRAARALAALGPEAPPLARVQNALATAEGRVLTGAKPGLAATAAAALEGLGVRTRQVPASPTFANVGAGVPVTRSSSGPPVSSRVPWAVAAGVAAVALAAGLLLWVRRAPSAAPAGSAPSGGAAKLSRREIADVGLRSTVALRCDDSLGSGFFVAPDKILTNAHVVCPGGTLQVKTADGRKGTGREVRSDARLDLALVEVEGLAGVPLPLGDAGDVRVGDRVAIVGSPVGLDFTVTQGSISNLDRIFLGVAYVQTDAPVNPGNSGGPMLDEHGRVVAVVSLKRKDAEGIGLALPINYAFTGGEAMVSAPPGKPSEGFAMMAGRAREVDEGEARKLAATGQRPGLVGAVVAGGMVQLQIVWPTAFDPGRQTFDFVLWKKRERVCSLRTEVTEWTKVEGEDGTSVLSPQVKGWLERHGFASDLYVAVAMLDYGECPADKLGPGVELEMEGADSDAARIRF